MRISLSRKAGGFLAAMVVTGGIFVAAQPAYALGPWVHVTTYHNGWAMGTCNVSKTPYYDYGAVDDNRADGIGVYCRFKLSNGSIRDVSDPDGDGGVSGVLDLRDTPYYIKEMQAVARNTSASAWTATGG